MRYSQDEEDIMHIPSLVPIAALATAGAWGIWGSRVGGIVALVSAAVLLVLGVR